MKGGPLTECASCDAFWRADPVLCALESYAREALVFPGSIVELIPWRCKSCKTVGSHSVLDMVLGGNGEPEVLNCGPCGAAGGQARKERFELEHTGPALILSAVEGVLSRDLAGIVQAYAGPPVDPLLRALQAYLRIRKERRERQKARRKKK